MQKGKALGVMFSEPSFDDITTTDVTVSNDLTMGDAGNIILNTTTGTKIGTAADQKIGFLGATPVIQQTGGTDAPAVVGQGNTSAYIASIQSIALAAASLANTNAAILASFGLSD